MTLSEALKILKQKLLDYYHAGRPESIPEYALHRILFLLATHPDLVRKAHSLYVRKMMKTATTSNSI